MSADGLARRHCSKPLPPRARQAHLTDVTCLTDAETSLSSPSICCPSRPQTAPPRAVEIVSGIRASGGGALGRSPEVFPIDMAATAAGSDATSKSRAWRRRHGHDNLRETKRARCRPSSPRCHGGRTAQLVAFAAADSHPPSAVRISSPPAPPRGRFTKSCSASFPLFVVRMRLRARARLPHTMPTLPIAGPGPSSFALLVASFEAAGGRLRARPGLLDSCWRLALRDGL